MRELHNILPDSSVDGAGEFVTHASQVLQDGGLVFGDGIAIKTAHAVHGMPIQEVTALQAEATAIAQVYIQLPKIIQSADFAVLGISQQAVDLSLETLGSQSPVMLLAFDVVQGKIVDPNIDKTDAIGLIDPIQEVFGAAFPQLLGLMHGLDAHIVEQTKTLTGKEHPNVFILEAANNKFHQPQAAFAQSHGYTMGTIADFSQVKGIDIVIRTMGAEEIFTDPKTYRPLLDALKNGMPMVNPLIASFASHKGLIPLLIHNGDLPSDWFANVTLIASEQVVGSRMGREEIIHLVKNSRGEFVVKEAKPGGKVLIGADMTRVEWIDVVKSLEASGKPFVIENYLDIPKSTIIVGERRYVNESVRIKEQQVRPLLKIYYIGGKIVAEMILGPKKNVNGSGYTIPVAFEEE